MRAYYEVRVRAEKAEARVAELEAAIMVIRTHTTNRCLHDDRRPDQCLDAISEACDRVSPPSVSGGGVEGGVAQNVRERSGQSTPETAPAAVQAVTEHRSCKPGVPGSIPGSSLDPAHRDHAWKEEWSPTISGAGRQCIRVACKACGLVIDEPRYYRQSDGTDRVNVRDVSKERCPAHPRSSEALVRCWRCKHEVPEAETVCNAGIGTQCKDSKACRGRWYGEHPRTKEPLRRNGIPLCDARSDGDDRLPDSMHCRLPAGHEGNHWMAAEQRPNDPLVNWEAEANSWRHVVAYFLGDRVDSMTPDEARATAVQETIDRGRKDAEADPYVDAMARGYAAAREVTLAALHAWPSIQAIVSGKLGTGPRPETVLVPSDLERAKQWCTRLRLGQSDSDDESLARLFDQIRRETYGECAEICRREAVYRNDRGESAGAFASENIEGRICDLTARISETGGGAP